MIGAAAITLLAALLQPAGDTSQDFASPGRGQVTCDVSAVIATEGLLLIGCKEATAEGVRYFGLDRDTRRYEDVRDFALWAQENSRPLGIWFYEDSDRNPKGCLENCRHIFAVVRR